MNDNELSTMVRESVTGVHSATPIAQIISRGRAVRARRRTPALAGAAAVLAGATLAVTTLLPSGHPGVQGSRHSRSPLANARLAAWTVAKQTNGDIDVTIRQLKNPVGLQRTLRADGLPVNVSFSGHTQAGSCQFDPISNDVLNAVVQFQGGSTAGGTVFLVIKPSALPTGAGLAIFVGRRTGDLSMPAPSESPGTAGSISGGALSTSADGHVRTVAEVSASPVYASQQCTG